MIIMDDNTNAVVPEVLDTESITKERETNIENEAESKTVTSMTMDNEIVQSNALVEGCYALTDVEQRVLFALISAIGNDKTLKRITVRIKDVADMCNLTQKNAYTQIDNVCDRLIQKAVIIKTQDRNGKRASFRHPWFAELNNKEVSGVVTYQFHKSLANELLELKSLGGGGWVSITQGTVNKLESAFAIRFYILFLKWLKIGHLNLSVEQIITLFDLKGKYMDKRTKKLNCTMMLQRVVYPAIERINSITNMIVGYELQKLGRSITGIMFRFRLKQEHPETVPDTDTNKIDIPSLAENKEWRTLKSVKDAFDRLYANGFNKSASLTNQILDKFDNEDDFKNAVSVALDELTKAKMSSAQVSNPGGLLYSKIIEFNPEEHKIFQAEAEAEKQKEMDKTKKRIEFIANATVWEDIIHIAKSQNNVPDTVKILHEAKKSRKELYENYKEAYRLTYPDTYYDVDLEIASLTSNNDINSLKDVKVDYDLLDKQRADAPKNIEELKERLAKKMHMPK